MENSADKRTLFWKRGTAYLVDLFCIYISTVLTMTALLFAFAILKHITDGKQLIELAENERTRAVAKVLQFIYYISYFTIAHWYFGKTIGKYFLGIHVCTSQNKDLTMLRSLGRTFAYIISGYPTLGIGYVIAYFRTDGKALHDLIAGTQVLAPKEANEIKLDIAA